MDQKNIRNLTFTAVLQPEDYGPVLHCMIIKTETEKDHAWIRSYRFPGEIRAVIRSDEMGNPAENGAYESVFPVSGPEIEWTQGFVYDHIKERNEYREWKLPGLQCTRVVCPILERFTRRKAYTKFDITLEYMDYLPEAYHNRKGVRTTRKGTLPLIIWLHGLGEGGTDPTLVLLGNRVTALSEVTVQQYFPENGAAVLAPQCPTMWMDTDGQQHWKDENVFASNGRSFYTEVLKGLIRKYLQLHPEIDRSRIYIGGCSNGGFMTLNMILAMPDTFAAAFPICPAYHQAWMTPKRIREFAKVPMWVTAAATDTTVPLRDSEGGPAFADALSEKMGKRNNFVYSRLPQVMGFDSKGLPYEYFGHWSWIPVLDDRVTKEFKGEEIHLFEWLAAKHL